MITYENQNGAKNARGVRQWNINVRLDGKLVGQILSVAGGYRYKPNGTRTIGGLIYPTLAEVKASIEGRE